MTAATLQVPRRRGTGSPLGQVLVGLGALYFVLPVVWLCIASTKSIPDLVQTNGFAPPAHPQLWDNVQRTLTHGDGEYLRWAANTLLYAGVGALVATALSACAGYAVAKFEFPGRSVLFAVTVGSIMVPVTALAIPTYLLLSPVGLTNTIWSVLLPSCLSPLGVYICRLSAASAVPDEILQAARMDGAGEWRTFVVIALRLMQPALVTVFLFQFVSIWNNYLLPLVMLSSSDRYPLSIGLASWNEQLVTSSNPPLTDLVVTGSLLSVVPLVVAFVVLQRYWRSGLGAGAVVG